MTIKGIKSRPQWFAEFLCDIRSGSLSGGFSRDKILDVKDSRSHFRDVVYRFPKDSNLAWSSCRTIIVSSCHSPPSGISAKGRCNHPGASSLRLATRLGDESTRDTAAGWPDLINRSHALPADKWWAGG